VLNVRAAPDVGGDTLWASLYAAYDRLWPAMPDMLAGLCLDLDLGTSADLIRKMRGEEHYTKVVEPATFASHPLIRVHPETCNYALFVCGSFMRGISGMHKEESDALLGYLQSLLDDPNLQCRWRWEQYDGAMGNERCTNDWSPTTTRTAARSAAASWALAYPWEHATEAHHADDLARG
jgi:taurine dioxygenase